MGLSPMCAILVWTSVVPKLARESTERQSGRTNRNPHEARYLETKKKESIQSGDLRTSRVRGEWRRRRRSYRRNTTWTPNGTRVLISRSAASSTRPWPAVSVASSYSVRSLSLSLFIYLFFCFLSIFERFLPDCCSCISFIYIYILHFSVSKQIY
jgi:hypothetical protein